jgi:hypothetical protein
MPSTYGQLNDAYYSSAYNQKLGSQGKAKGFWDWMQDPNRENYDPNDYANSQSFLANQSGTTNQSSTQPSTINPVTPIGGSDTVASPNNQPPVIQPPISGTTSFGNLTNNSIVQSSGSNPSPITTNSLAPNLNSAISRKRLSSFGMIP